MKNIIFFLVTIVIISCGDNKPAVNVDSLKTDSALKAQLTKSNMSVSTDSVNMTALPPVFEGDIVMQISEDPQHIAFGKACGSKYNHAGMIFIRPKDRMFMVMEVNDSVTATPLTEWINRGQDDHVVVMRLKDANQILNERKTMQLKKGAKDFRGKSEDDFYSWTDNALYSTELVWKMYANLKIEICEPGKISDMNMTGTVIGEQMTKNYGAGIPKNEKFISPDAIYKSTKLVVVYER